MRFHLAVMRRARSRLWWDCGDSALDTRNPPVENSLQNDVDCHRSTRDGPARGTHMVPDVSATRRGSTTGLRRFLDLRQQRDGMEGKTVLRDADERAESPELRLKYVARFEKLLRRPQAREVLEILRRYGRDCIPIPRRTERHYWSVSCLPSTPGKALVRVNASWMELFALYPDGAGIRAKLLVHLSDFTRDHSTGQDQVDESFLE